MPDQGDEQTVDDAVMGLLHDHVPLTLLVDLVDAPASEEVLREEGLPEQHWWTSEQAPEGVPSQIAPERLEEFAPGLDPDLLQLIQATADMEMADIDATFGPMTTK